MKSIKTYYAKLNNMGDLLSEYLIPYITGRGVIHCEKVSDFQIMGVGSCGGALWGKKESGVKENIKDFIKKSSCIGVDAPCAVWGTGFIKDYYPQQLELLRKNVSFIAVRGRLSQRIIEQSLGERIEPVLCDGGILASELLKKIPETKYEIGFIPHYNEQKLVKENGMLEAMRNKYSKFTVINLREEPLEVIRKIGECEKIISTSLHGCVIADSFGIPNLRLTISSIPGTGFKFDDYYSGYNLEVPGIKVTEDSELPDEDFITSQYKITASMVNTKKKEMNDVLTDFVRTI